MSSIDGSRAVPISPASNNFLEEIRIGTPYEVADAQNVAIMICDPEGKGFKDHWDKTAYALITGLILHECYRAIARGEVASLPDVAYSLSDPSRTADALYQEMVNNRHLNGQRHSVVGAAGRDQLNREPKERTSVPQHGDDLPRTLPRPADRRQHANERFPRRRPDEPDDKPVSLYILVPGSDKVRLRPLVRLMLTMIMRGLTGVDIRYDEGKPILPHKHRLLLMLDEFPSLGRMTSHRGRTREVRRVRDQGLPRDAGPRATARRLPRARDDHVELPHPDRLRAEQDRDRRVDQQDARHHHGRHGHLFRERETIRISVKRLPHFTRTAGH